MKNRKYMDKCEDCGASIIPSIEEVYLCAFNYYRTKTYESMAHKESEKKFYKRISMKSIEIDIENMEKILSGEYDKVLKSEGIDQLSYSTRKNLTVDLFNYYVMKLEKEGYMKN